MFDSRSNYCIHSDAINQSPLSIAVSNCAFKDLSIETYNIQLTDETIKTKLKCKCIENAEKNEKVEATNCELIAKLRRRLYSKKVVFGELTSAASKLRSNLREWTPPKFLQNCMGKPENQLKLEKVVAIPMLAKSHPLRRTVSDELIEAIVNGVTHHCLQVVFIKDMEHHVKRLLPDEEVGGVIWVGPDIPKGSQVIFGVYVGEVKLTRDMVIERDAYAIEVAWTDPHRRYIRDKSYRKKVEYHQLWKKQKVDKMVSLDEENIDDEIGINVAKKKMILPPVGYFLIDGMDVFNEIVMINDPRNVCSDLRLKANAKFYQVYYEGWPYYIIASNPAHTLLHGEELLVNCGAAYRFGHLLPLTEKALLQKALNANQSRKKRCLNGWLKRQLPFEKIDEMIDSVREISWDSDDDLPDKDDSDESDASTC